jgi:hypothetical protein
MSDEQRHPVPEGPTNADPAELVVVTRGFLDAAMAAYAALTAHVDAQQDLPHQACYAHMRRIDAQVGPMTVAAAVQQVAALHPGTSVTEWALLRGPGVLNPGTMFAGPTAATSQPTWGGFLPSVTAGMVTVHRTVTYGPWANAETGEPVEAMCNGCRRPAGAGAYGTGRLCNLCAVTS